MVFPRTHRVRADATNRRRWRVMRTGRHAIHTTLTTHLRCSSEHTNNNAYTEAHNAQEHSSFSQCQLDCWSQETVHDRRLAVQILAQLEHMDEPLTICRARAVYILTLTMKRFWHVTFDGTHSKDGRDSEWITARAQTIGRNYSTAAKHSSYYSRYWHHQLSRTPVAFLSLISNSPKRIAEWNGDGERNGSFAYCYGYVMHNVPKSSLHFDLKLHWHIDIGLCLYSRSQSFDAPKCSEDSQPNHRLKIFSIVDKVKIKLHNLGIIRMKNLYSIVPKWATLALRTK